MTPAVTFIIPCYKLAHLLTECVESILGQSYKNFEILIMDDCSPDDTPQVAKSFQDERVRYFRNDPNLGHLRNYNKGIELARGQYIWLISADDRLRCTYVLERYVQIMEAHPRVGYVFCPAIGLENGEETGIASWTFNGSQDAILRGHKFLSRLIHVNSVAAPSGLVRRECYEKISVFPLDLPYAGDWYLWCAFALHREVAYLSEPMINYRIHQLSMTNHLTRPPRNADNLAVRWRIKCLAEAMGARGVVRECLKSIAEYYAYCLQNHFALADEYSMTLGEFERSLHENTRAPQEERRIQARVYASVGDGHYRRGEFHEALSSYALGLRFDKWMPMVWMKAALLRMGSAEMLVRQSLGGPRETAQKKTAR